MMTPEFETWGKENHCLTESAWKAWQAATLIEREACAKVCELLTHSAGTNLYHGAHEIRKRSNEKITGAEAVLLENTVMQHTEE